MPRMSLAAGTKLGPYEIESPLGAGGMGEVYRALDTRLDRTVAIKILPEHLSQSPEAKQRFDREARAISSLNHPNICTLHDVGHQNGTDYLVMELASPMAAHPMTGHGFVVGTFQYMSPEQVEGKEADARSDIFALGSVLYEMATGKRAFEGKSNLSVASAIIEKEPEPLTSVQPMAPPALDHVVRGCLVKDPDARWQNAGDIALQLRWISTSSQSGAVALPGHPGRKNWDRIVWLALAVLILILVGWLAFRPQPVRRTVQAY